MVRGEIQAAGTLYDSNLQYYDAVMEFAHGADEALRKDPRLAPTSIKGPVLFDAMTTMLPFVGMQGKIVLDEYGLKEGFFAVRNVWGKKSIKVLLMDTWARKCIDYFNPNLLVTDLSGNVTWKFQGNPTLFMGNGPDSSGPDSSYAVSPHPCPVSRTVLRRHRLAFGPAARANLRTRSCCSSVWCSIGWLAARAHWLGGAGNTTEVPQNVIKGHCLPGTLFVPSKAEGLADPDTPCPGCCIECQAGFFIEPGSVQPSAHLPACPSPIPSTLRLSCNPA